jgi:hypothetical protein
MTSAMGQSNRSAETGSFAREDDGDHTYELLDLANEKSWRWSDPWKQRLRLHTKEIAKPA